MRKFLIATILFIPMSALFAQDRRSGHLSPPPESTGQTDVTHVRPSSPPDPGALRSHVRELEKQNLEMQKQIDALSKPQGSSSTRPASGGHDVDIKTDDAASAGRLDESASLERLTAREAELQKHHDFLQEKLFTLRSGRPIRPSDPTAEYPWSFSPYPTDDLLGTMDRFPKEMSRKPVAWSDRKGTDELEKWAYANLARRTVTFPAIFNSTTSAATRTFLPAPTGSQAPADSVSVRAVRTMQLAGCKINITVSSHAADHSPAPKFASGQPIQITGQITETNLSWSSDESGTSGESALRLNLTMAQCTYSALALPKPLEPKETPPSIEFEKLLGQVPDSIVSVSNDRAQEAANRRRGGEWSREKMVGRRVTMTAQIIAIHASPFAIKHAEISCEGEVQFKGAASSVSIRATPPDWSTPEGLDLWQTVEIEGTIADPCDFLLPGQRHVRLDDCTFKVIKQGTARNSGTHVNIFH